MSTKLLRPIEKYLWARGARIVIYIDDVLAKDTGFEQTSALCKLIRWTLCKAEFVNNEEKSGLRPALCKVLAMVASSYFICTFV